jgi:ribosome recycling factor
MTIDLGDLERRMQGAVDSLHNEFNGLRTGRAHVGLLDSVKPLAYGNPTPLNQVATVSVLDSRMLGVNVWDKANAPAIEKAIREAGLGLNPIAEGNSIRIPMPELTEDRRKELVKVAAKIAEDAKIAVRNVRRDGMDEVKKSEKDKAIGEDEAHTLSDKVQKLTDQYVTKIESDLDAKTKDIMKV